MALDSMQQLFLNELKDVYNAEKQLVRALPRLAKAAQSPDCGRLSPSTSARPRSTSTRLERIFACWSRRPGARSARGWKV